jgi:hypothetical protein
MTTEIHSLPATKLEHEIELLQELGGDLNKFAQKVGHYLRHDPENKALRGLSSRLCRNGMYLDREWGQLLDQHRALKRGCE